MLPIILSFGNVYALIPLLVIIILIAAAAGISRGYDIFSIFGIGVLAGIGGKTAGKGSLAGKSAYKGRAGSVISTPLLRQGNLVGKYAAKGAVGTATFARARTPLVGSQSRMARSLTNEVLAKTSKSAGAPARLTVKGVPVNAKTALGALAGGAAVVGGASVARVFGGRSYGNALKKYEQASNTKEKEKWAAKMEEIRAKHRIKPRTLSETGSATDAINSINKVAKSEGRFLTAEEHARVGNLAKIQALHEELQEVRRAYRASGNKEKAKAEVKRLVKEFHTNQKKLADTSVFSRTAMDKRMDAVTYTPPSTVGTKPLQPSQTPLEKAPELGAKPKPNEKAPPPPTRAYVASVKLKRLLLRSTVKDWKKTAEGRAASED